MDNEISYQTENDFEKAKTRARMQVLLSTLRWKNTDLLSFYEVTDLIKPKNQTYRGMQTIPIKNIIGSEGRHRDFSMAFYPKKEMLKERWKSIDQAHLNLVELPAISVYKLGDWYFVRDGNHRVSVAKSQGVSYIDAEVVELDSEISLEQGMTMKQLKKKVIQYERKQFLDQYHAQDFLPMDEITFTSPGMYPQLVNHILVHKYYINENRKDEVSFRDAAVSWYENVYSPIIEQCRKDHLLASFPGNTEGDLYMWIVRHWDELKKVSGSQDVSIESATIDYKRRYGKGGLTRWIRLIQSFFSKKNN
ncbi:MAG: transcriptional regulator [Spirochaetia bacterium]|nr:transcriptional regulator [Spirochaetia bacterium]